MKRAFVVLAALCGALGLLCRAVTGMRFSAALLLSLAAFFTLLALLRHLGESRRWAKRWERVLEGVFCLGAAFFLVLEAVVIAGAHTDAEGHDVSCVIILGAGVNGTVPSLSLKTRLDAALDFLADKPDVPVICSGGQGGGEEISEAECMARYLISHGVAAERILREERSASTRENFDFSLALMAEEGIDTTADFAFVSSDYHLARARRMAGVPWVYGVAAKMPRGVYFDALEVNYFVREAFGLAHELVFGW